MKSWIDKNYKIYFPKARGEIKDILYPCYADTKYDGELNFIINNEMVNKDKYGRHRADFPALDEVLAHNIPDGYVIAGELYYGSDVYEFLRNKDNDDLKFAAFDIWQYKQPVINNEYIPIDRTPYKDRRALLEQILTNGKHAHVSACKIVNNKIELDKARQAAINNGQEGLITKHGLSLWANADLKSWTKLKKESTADLIIMGYSRKAKYLSLLLGHISNGKLTALCGCGSGLTFAQKTQYAAMLEQEKLPPNQQNSKEYILTKPKYLAEVSYQELTHINGQISALRHPVFIRLRDDKTINDVSIL